MVLIGTSRVGYGAFPVAQLVKSPPAAQKSWLQSLGWKDPLEKEMTTRFNILAWEIPWIQATVHAVSGLNHQQPE